MSRLFSQTLREIPAEAESVSHQLLLRAGFIRQTAAGIFTYLHLGQRALVRISEILREEMRAIGGSEILMPVVNPADLWKETKRWDLIDAELGRFKDRADRDMVLAMTHEEVITDLVRKEIRSYRQLPQLLFHIQTKWRDDPRPRAGLIRAREFIMKDSYSLDTDWEGLDHQYRAHYQAYFNIFRRCGLDVLAVSADVGMMGGLLAHEFMYLTPIGEDTLLLCAACGYSANRQVANFMKIEPPREEQQLLETVLTPNCKTIEELATFLDIPTARTAKAVFLIAETQNKNSNSEQFMVFAIVRGDMEVNETKLLNGLKARTLRPATEEEIRSTGAEPGYASPVGLKSALGKLTVKVVVDELVAKSANLVAGANRAGYHLKNVNYGRDFTADMILDITAAQDGDACPHCSSKMRAARGVELGNIFKLGTRYSDAMGCNFQDKDGSNRPIIMGSYGIGLGRLLACIAEACHDDRGLVWPISVAPFPVHLVLLAGKRTEDSRSLSIQQAADQVYQSFQNAGIEILYDERNESPGVKFNDADLIGLPIRLTMSERSIAQGGIEVKRRDQKEQQIIEIENILEWTRNEIAVMEAALKQKIRFESF
jgi:prolyl-tRNA synthetase